MQLYNKDYKILLTKDYLIKFKNNSKNKLIKKPYIEKTKVFINL